MPFNEVGQRTFSEKFERCRGAVFRQANTFDVRKNVYVNGKLAGYADLADEKYFIWEDLNPEVCGTCNHCQWTDDRWSDLGEERMCRLNPVALFVDYHHSCSHWKPQT